MVAVYSVLPCVILTNMGGGAGIEDATATDFIFDVDFDVDVDFDSDFDFDVDFKIDFNDDFDVDADAVVDAGRNLDRGVNPISSTGDPSVVVVATTIPLLLLLPILFPCINNKTVLMLLGCTIIILTITMNK